MTLLICVYVFIILPSSSFVDQVTGLRLSSLGSSQLTVSVKGRGDRVEYTAHATASTFCIPAVFSLLPPVCTLVIAVVIGQVGSGEEGSLIVVLRQARCVFWGSTY